LNGVATIEAAPSVPDNQVAYLGVRFQTT